MNSIYPDALAGLVVVVDEETRAIKLTLANHDTTALEVTNGPPMIEHPAIRAGRPTSLWDILASFHWQKMMYADTRIVPADRDFSGPMPDETNQHMFDHVLLPTLHREWTSQVKWRGRPSAFTRFNLDQLVRWRDDVFKGYITIRELARAAEVSEPAAARFAHGETLWYV